MKHYLSIFAIQMFSKMFGLWVLFKLWKLRFYKSFLKSMLSKLTLKRFCEVFWILFLNHPKTSVKIMFCNLAHKDLVMILCEIRKKFSIGRFCNFLGNFTATSRPTFYKLQKIYKNYPDALKLHRSDINQKRNKKRSIETLLLINRILNIS